MKTKSLIITLIAILGLCSCGKSKEEKAQEMAANYLKGVLYHFDSYEPLQQKLIVLLLRYQQIRKQLNSHWTC